MKEDGWSRRKMGLKKNLSKYVHHRKKLLKEEMGVVYERDKLTAKIRQIRKELNSWDRWLVREK